MAKSFNAMELRKTLLEKKASLLGTDKPVYKTNCMFRPQQFSQRSEFDIRTASKLQLLDGFKHIINHVTAATELGVDINHLGFTIAEWKDDFKLRVAVLDRADTLKKIATMETKLRAVLTPKELRAIGIEDLAAEIDGI